MTQTNTTDVPTASATRLIAEMAQLATTADPFEIATEGLGPGLPAKVPLLWDHKNQKPIDVHQLVEAWRLQPDRRKGSAQALSLGSFIELVRRHKDAHSAVFGVTTWPHPQLVAVIDYHQTDGVPRWGGHRIGYDFPLTDEFKAWVGMDGKAMEQLDFAAFIENHAAELASPFDAEINEFEPLMKERFGSPSELIKLSRELEIKVGARVKRQERLSTGERVVEFSAEHSNADGNKVDVPGLFMVSVPAFLDGEAVRIPARLRYRIAGGELRWFYQLYRWQFWLRERVRSDLFLVGKQTELPTFEGTPEA